MSDSSTDYFHVGDHASIPMVVTNTTEGALTDAIGVEMASAASAGIVTSVSSAGYTSQGQSTTLTVGLNTSNSGSYAINDDNFSFLSHDPDLPDIAASVGTNDTAFIQINSYADPFLVNEFAGQSIGTLTNSGDNQWNLGFGYVIYDNNDPTAAQATIAIQNGISGESMDNLEGTLSASGDGFSDADGLNISGDYASPGDSLPMGQFSPEVNLLGAHTETVTFSPVGFNASGYFGALPNETLTITDNVVSSSDVPIAMFLQDQAALNQVSGGFSIVDTAADVVGQLAALQADKKLNSITLTGTSPLTLTAAQVGTHASVLAKLAGSNQVAIVDTAANIAAEQPAINAFIATGHVTSVSTSNASLAVAPNIALTITGNANTITSQAGAALSLTGSGDAITAWARRPI